ncbi:putative L-seryl-tRNA(Sec) selenium transferase [Hafnia paralvei ATCC 29927]|jgi:D-glucosaminate-6-phosphate ammonia-lyase|uniref:D-glucosaminate-6-phosphate ammonia lyase n=1 Tax=Hafnia paralvei TaxID=546367 RepID=UPI0007E41ECD|nr:DgaE family pyridoxal phosphate-dependent ammonia lyase [Hafnia paralvei]MDU1192366.1 DgaE family pyridoxal phosphate-dependent ammonia lyase [Enterobacteriaceae bacterium]MBW2958517.1 DgaE family pyridoxal phosphate-dependent ammonia lyase [Hafnia paralvei]MCQ4169980.1 DgaE family pyridoxal phosphate-dependent ammonia lyase [Hafnia paralvei]MDU1244383.1 DgaE family pyridoxal phosphate-dependent ammonia lyase [Enterobacteriaceae bacterium]OAT40420.1 putative L-seryl-tRNA(Sec) selenium trans
MNQNIYQRLGLKRVINACGKMTILGVSAVSPEVMQATAEAAGSFVEIDKLVDRTGQLVSTHTGAEDSYITSCASAGIAIAVAAVITRGEPDRVALMPDSSGMANEVLMLRGHNIDYGAPITSAIRLGGGRVVEVGQSNLAARWQLEKAISERTAALLFVKSHHSVQKGMLTLADFVEVAKAHQLPLIVDAAAEEDLRLYVSQGADLVIYSGAKAFNAPTSGFITGKREWIECCKAQHHGIARAMKIGKENMVGLVKALELYAEGADSMTPDALATTVDAISALHGFSAEIEQDEAGRAIWRVQVRVHPDVLGIDARQVEALLRTGDVAIYTRRYFLHQGVFSIDPRTLDQSELAMIVERLAQISAEQENCHAKH